MIEPTGTPGSSGLSDYRTKRAPGMTRPAFEKPSSAADVVTILHHTLAYYDFCQENHLDKLLGHGEQEKEVAGAYAVAKDRAYRAGLCDKASRGEFVKTAEVPWETPHPLTDVDKAWDAVRAYQGAVVLLDAEAEELKHTETELSVARRMHDTAMMMGALFAGVDVVVVEGRVEVTGATVASKAGSALATRRKSTTATR